MSHQHAPSPDYRLHETTGCLDLRECGDCGDLCFTAQGVDRCETCQALHLDELAICKRVVVQQIAIALASAFARSGGMNDPREILCEECGEVAVTYTGNADSLDRVRTHGECGCYGVIDVDQDDEGHVRVRFLGAS